MESDTLKSVSPEMLRVARYFIGPLAQGIVRDFALDGRSESDSIVFAMRLLDSDVVDRVNDWSLFKRAVERHTSTAIMDACQRVIDTRITNEPYYRADSLRGSICSKILTYDGYMATQVRTAFIQAFGQNCHKEIRIFWSYLGVDTDEDGILSIPW